MKFIEKMLLTEGQVYKPSQPYTATLVENTRITPENSADDVRHLVFTIEGSGIEYLEGQSVGVVPPGETAEGKRQKVRLYSISSARGGDAGKQSTVSLTVKRVAYQDDQGQEQKGLASNYLTDLKVGEQIQLTGPVGRKFLLPQDDSVNLIMVAVGTGIAPFRAFIEHIYREKGGWKGCVRLFYGSKTGLESLYMNQEKNDIGQYFTQNTFKAFQALSRENAVKKEYVQDKIKAAKDTLWPLLKEGNFAFYLCGLKDLETGIEDIFSTWATEENLNWEEMRNGFKENGQWIIEVY